MDSPERSQIVTSKPSSPPVQDSPCFNCIIGLSPIKPGNARHVLQGFSELNFPPPVFTSPRINPQRETSYRKRSECPNSSNPESSLGQESRAKKLTDEFHVSERSVSRPMVGLVPCSHKEYDSKATKEVQPHSPSGSVEEYLADSVEVGNFAKSTDSADLRMEQAHDMSQVTNTGSRGPKVTITKLDGDDEKKVIETEVAASLTLSEQAGEDFLGESLVHVKPANSECEQKDVSEKVNDLVESSLAFDPISCEHDPQNLVADVSAEPFSLVSNNMGHTIVDFDEERHACCGSQDVRLQNAEGGQQVGLDSTPQLPSECLQGIQVNENYDEIPGAISNRPVENSMLYDVEEEDNQHQRGMRRRCLQFEAARGQGGTVSNNLDSWNATNILLDARSPTGHTDLEIMNSLHLQSRSTSRNRQPVNLSRPITSRLTILPVKKPEAREVDRPVQSSFTSSMKTPMPSGIGLHLNSIVNAAAMCCKTVASTKFADKDYSRSYMETSTSVIEHDEHEDPKSGSLPTSVVEKFSDAVVRASSATFQSSEDMKLVKATLQMELIEHHVTPFDERKTASENSDRFEELNQLNSKKKRKRTSNSIEDDGCKRCNCKRSKCLKLYCECFAAGIYCAGTCSCQGCFNKPEYEDTVLGTRQQIESKNPLAFAPKILRRVTESPANSGEDGSQVTPVSGRHKKGCNCKKSMCLKKYCECYQAGVGCADGCRCEGCKNPFGVKEGYDETREMAYRKAGGEKLEDLSVDNNIRSDLLHPELGHPHSLSPVTPMFQSSNHGKDIIRSRVLARRYDPSPESERQVKTSQGTSEIVTYDLELESSTTGSVDQTLPIQDEHSSLWDLTPLPNVPSRVTVSSSASNTSGREKASKGRVLHESVSLSSLAPLRWRGSPVTPLPRLTGNKFSREPDSDSSRLYEIQEDDTPEILKDSRTPIKAIKASSPNQKRVSPPQNHSQEPRSSSSPSLKSARKYVLRSISAFPSLTPYSDPKGGGSSNK